MWDLILLVPDHCLSFYFALNDEIGAFIAFFKFRLDSEA